MSVSCCNLRVQQCTCLIQMVRFYPVRADYLDDQISFFPLTISSHRKGELFGVMPYLGNQRLKHGEKGKPMITILKLPVRFTIPPISLTTISKPNSLLVPNAAFSGLAFLVRERSFWRYALSTREVGRWETRGRRGEGTRGDRKK